MQRKVRCLEPEIEIIHHEIDIIIITNAPVLIGDPGRTAGIEITIMIEIVGNTDNDIPEQQQVLEGIRHVTVIIVGSQILTMNKITVREREGFQ